MTRRSFRIPWRIYARLGLYFAACWTLVGLLLRGVLPYAVGIAVVLALYTTIPLVLFLRLGGWPFYPTAAFRLLVMRPFWYAQMLLPLVTIAGMIGPGSPASWASPWPPCSSPDTSDRGAS
jgi:hypothetical protein